MSLLSLFGNPQYLLSNLNATSNALSAQISAQSGFPFVADEATRSKIDFDELIYSLSSGKGKRRCDGDGTLKALVNFSGAAFFSSEQPILDKCAQQGGEEARVVEFELDWFDGDGKKAEKFMHFFNNHYGVATAPLASLLLDKKIQLKIAKYYLKAEEKLSRKFQIKDGIDKRIVQRFAIIAVSCWLLEKAIKVDFHIENIVKLLVEIFKDKQTRICRTDSTERLLQLFIEDYIHSRDKYGMSVNDKKSARHDIFARSHSLGSLRGIASEFQGRKCLWLPTDTFNEILSRQTTYGASTAKKKLHEKGYLQKFGNAYYRWYNFGEASTNAYCVFLPEHTETACVAEDKDAESALQINPLPPLMAGFVSLTSQQIDMVINAELASKLGVKNKGKLFLHTWGAKEFLLLTTKASEKAVPLDFQKVNNSFVATDDALKAVLQASNIRLERRKCLLLSDITVSGKTPSAMLYIDNPHGQWYETINDSDPYRVMDKICRKSKTNRSNIQALLEE